MKKRKFIKTGAILGAGALVSPLISCKQDAKDNAKTNEQDTKAEAATMGAFSLPDLPYAHNALEPYIDVQTMEIHHGKHHAGYVKKLNNALSDSNFSGKTIQQIVSSVGKEDTAIRNNGGGHYNHSLFWKVMKPGGGSAPTGNLGDAINSTFGSFENFATAFSNAAATQFGSGWGWLCAGVDGKLFVTSTANQDNPLMKNIVEQSGIPLLGIDVWEHAYYLKYQNMRKEYISNFLKGLVNWEEVAKNYSSIM